MKKALLALIILLFFSMQHAAGMQDGIANKRMGDIIAVTTDNELAAWCNFNKQIVVTATRVLCVYNGSATDPTQATEQ